MVMSSTMKQESAAMWRGNTLIKNIWIVLLPAVLTGFLAFQLLKCGSVLDRRNSYLVENLPSSTNWVWNALSGCLYPFLYARDDQPGGMIKNRMSLSHHSGDANRAKVDLATDKMSWQKNIMAHHKDYRESVLVPGLPSLTVHFLWCTDGHFELSHYIGVLSALHQFRPDKMIVHYLVKPRKDPDGYWRWLEDLERDIAMLTLKQLTNSRHCSHALSAGVKQGDFPDAHGIFILGDVAITNLTRPDVVKMMAKSYLGKHSDSVKMKDLNKDEWSKSQMFIVPNSVPYHISQSAGRVVLTCPPVSEFDNVKNLVNVPCVDIPSYFHFEELLRKDSRFFRFARTMLYGSPEIVNSHALKDIQVPNIFHIVLEETFPIISPLNYLSIKSAYINGKVEHVYIHCQNRPRGELWVRLLFSDNLKPTFVPTGSFLQSGNKHASMTYLLYTLLQHGGIAGFGDVVFVKPMPTSSRSVNAVASIHRSQYRQPHRTLNTAVLASSPGSEFIKEMLGMTHQADNSWPDVNLDDVATHLAELNANSLFVDTQMTSLQECEGGRCQTAGGHDPPSMVYTLRFSWKNGEPRALSELQAVQGPFTTEMLNLMKINH